MSAEILTLPVVYNPQGPMTRLEMVRERADDLRCRLMARTVDKVPFVVIRRSTLGEREVNAFNLGRECSRYLGR